MKTPKGVTRLPEVHQNISLKLFEAFKSAVAEKIVERGTIDAREFEAIYQRFLGMTDSFRPLFARVCSECQTSNTFVPDARRENLVYRFFISRVIELFEPPDTPMRDRLPRHLIPALGKSFVHFLGSDYYPALNREARDLFQYIGTDSDATIWTAIAADESAAFMAHRILLRIAQKFRDLKILGRNFVIDVNSHLPKDQKYRFSEEDFLELFGRIFGELESKMMAKGRNATTIDILFGDGTIEFMRRLTSDLRVRQESLPAKQPKRR